MRHKNDMMVCGSFAKKAGNLGMAIHNAAAKYHHMDFIYKSFSVDDIKNAIQAMRTLKLRGAGITMPFKSEVIQYLDEVTEDAKNINAVNTVVNEDGKLIGHNTDWQAASKMIEKKIAKFNVVTILGKGGFAKAVQYAVFKKSKFWQTIDRETWDKIPHIENSLVFNCTPVEGIKVHASSEFVDCITNTKTGRELAIDQAAIQFELYTGKSFPYYWINQELVGIA